MDLAIGTVSYGKPVMAPCLIPVEHKSTPNCINAPFMVNGECYKVTAMSFCSPHGVVFTGNVDSVDVRETGQLLGTHSLFPKGASIVFAQVLDGETIKVRIWQQNKGETGFSAEAVCIAGVTAMMLHKVLTDRVKVCAGNQEFGVEWNRETNSVCLIRHEDFPEA
ncbi:diaminopimelate epimerase [Thermoclostridium stercorarium subsp. stercorarium DSM 8532]|uniref:Diaminopimelate epimerase n=1 Tax=Thermoclostridium stercorarium (strain ATCC 35414 / DSM 8532 / NCIMB 11754) TaxID=1121335 RepID=L7VPK7_THES1|nr:diaminopimelate epimerase [Thermoclostridium stercorarium]AGC67508.1 diaminopimelate epimerase [Thermoclostridium stercorarium subsp. stercorarium DSM 8532]